MASRSPFLPESFTTGVLRVNPIIAKGTLTRLLNGVTQMVSRDYHYCASEQRPSRDDRRKLPPAPRTFSLLQEGAVYIDRSFLFRFPRSDHELVRLDPIITVVEKYH